MSKARRISFSSVCALGTALVAGEAASAEMTQPTTSEAVIEEIVVTATKKERSESVQEVPIAVTAFTLADASKAKSQSTRSTRADISRR